MKLIHCTYQIRDGANSRRNALLQRTHRHKTQGTLGSYQAREWPVGAQRNGPLASRPATHLPSLLWRPREKSELFAAEEYDSLIALEGIFGLRIRSRNTHREK